MKFGFRSLSAIGMLSICMFVSNTATAQQFVEQQLTRFPQPAALDYSNQLTIGDIDNDGDQDIIWANGGGFSSAGAAQVARIYINNGTGVFTDESVARGAASGWFRGVELGDIDNDGDLDMILAQDFNHQPILLLNNGSGFFTNVSATRLPAALLSSSRAEFADVDNDGDLDIYLVNGGTSSRFGTAQGKLYINDGAGFFTDGTAARMPNQTVGQPMDCIFADIDGDLDVDLRIGSRGAGSKLYRNNGAGVFSDISANCPADGSCYSYDFGDIEGDGDMDLLGANAGVSNAELLLTNNGTGVFANSSANISPNPTIDDNDSRFFDYDNDGDMDLVIASLGTAERIYNNNGAGVFTQVAGIITAIADSSLDVKVGDLNGDGKLDIVTAQGESGGFTNRIYINNGPADSRPPRIIKTEQLADTANRAGPYVVRASILDDMSSDRNFLDRGINLKYTVAGGTEQTVPMRYSGGQIYRGVIPGVPCGGLVTYHVEARDFANNLGVGTNKTFTVAAPFAGDLNDDTVIDSVDAGLLVGVLLGEDVNPLHVCTADINGDGFLDGNDIAMFVLALPTP